MSGDNLPPLIVIGLTGPIGSGCTTLAKFFDDPDDSNRKNGNQFLRKLVSDNYVKKIKSDYKVNWAELNNKVQKKLEEYARIKERLKKLDETSIPERLEAKKEKTFKELGRILEQRESLKSFSFLKPYYPKDKSHYFRTLSMSDLILFRVLKSIEEGESSSSKKFDQEAKNVIKKIVEDIKSLDNVSDINSIADFYDKIRTGDNIEQLIRVFKKIHDNCKKLKVEMNKISDFSYTEQMQLFGNNIRKCGDPFKCNTDAKATARSMQLAEDMVNIIDLIYKAKEASFFIIDCLRNPYEVFYLRKKVSDFFLISIFAEKETRLLRVKNDQEKIKGELKDENFRKNFNSNDELDSGKLIKESIERAYKQNVTKSVQISDYAINNLQDCLDKESILHLKLLRMISLILSPGCCKPTMNEVYMNMAYAMSVKSNCVCRQVGAIIKGKDGYIVGAGWNDVPRGEISCGLRTIGDLPKSPIHRNITIQVGETYLKGRYEKDKKNDNYSLDQACFCFKDEMVTKEVSKKIVKSLENSKNDKLKEHGADIKNLVKNAGLHQLEYCMALHAEENAIVQSARIGGMGIKGATIYSTAQPCTLCAKKIKQSGIKKAIYTDPYPKSLSDIFMNEVELEQFEGVKPRSYMKLFMANHDQKEWQDLEVKNEVPGFDFLEDKYYYN
ncbi:MAG: deaminase [Sedimentisphaeraceae bacterium JB056]